jgi:hypothetical protein
VVLNWINERHTVDKDKFDAVLRRMTQNETHDAQGTKRKAQGDKAAKAALVQKMDRERQLRNI